MVFATCSRFCGGGTHGPRVGRIRRNLGERRNGGKQEKQEKCGVLHNGKNV